MNIAFCSHHSNGQNIDTGLYGCVVCWKSKAPFTIYNRYGDRTPLTFKTFFWAIVESLKSLK